MKIEFTLNGKKVSADVDGSMPLLQLIREHFRLTGTKCGCSIGECGACTVIFNGKAVTSCLVMAGQVDGGEVMTVEGLANPDGSLSPLQRAFVEKHAVQCGFCTPGMLMSAAALLMENPDPSEAEIRRAISGNICRCTGYDAIVDAISAAAAEMRGDV